MRWRANAKINLSLEILGRREDGYHELNMVMASVSLCDWLEAEPAPPGISLSCSDPSVPCGPQNTVYRAAALFLESSGLAAKTGVRLFLEKAIPSQAGLGGGSADAAATLCALNALFHYPVSREDLLRIGLKVGADVPFCLTGGVCLAQGVGERLTRVQGLMPCAVVICKPPISVSTPEAFRRADSRAGAKSRFTDEVLHALEAGSLSALGKAIGNDFEEVMALPETAAVRYALLEAGAAGACMTGSGSAVFGLFASSAQAEACVQDLKRTWPQTFLCFPA